MQKTVLCYGDSNTWGYVPRSVNCAVMHMERYSRDERWTGILQKFLGDKFYVVEEGLNGRTTNLEYNYPPDRNGKNYLLPCLYSHAPIDLVVLALGGNDLISYFNRSPMEVCKALGELVDIIQQSSYGSQMQKAPEVLILPPPIPLPISEDTIIDDASIFDGAINKAKQLASLLENLARGKKCYYLDIPSIKPSEIDGVHFDKAGHLQLASMLEKKIWGIFSAINA